MTAMLTASDQREQATNGGGGRVIVGEPSRRPKGSPGPVLTQLVSAAGDVLVVGMTPGHSLKRLLHGSVSAYCASHLPGQVSVVRHGGGGHVGARG